MAGKHVIVKIEAKKNCQNTHRPYNVSKLILTIVKEKIVDNSSLYGIDIEI